MPKPDRAREIEKAIRLAWESLESHLYWTHHKSAEGIKFHIQAVKDYVKIIQVLSNLY